MDAAKTLRGFFKIAYAQDRQTLRRRGEAFHIGAGFDFAVVIALLIVVVGYLTT